MIIIRQNKIYPDLSITKLILIYDREFYRKFVRIVRTNWNISIQFYLLNSMENDWDLFNPVSVSEIINLPNSLYEIKNIFFMRRIFKEQKITKQ